jgi:hypothetical protein
MQPSIPKTGNAHNPTGHTHRVHWPGNREMTRPTASAPIAAVAVQPYQYISGARKLSAGSD